MATYYIWLPVMGRRSSVTTINASSKEEALKNAGKNYTAQLYNELPEFMQAMITPVVIYPMFISIAIDCVMLYNQHELRWEVAFYPKGQRYNLIMTAWYFDADGTNKPSAKTIWEDCKDDLTYEIWLD